ncbi:hypothetical protein B0H63DRAFT_468092 [Podospora didyma]|uniref:Uncharacterized protein n=1 Tax=Podospora didyma TaxID=330526 RepID=A0AAE0NS00_9PEZI|nr:hypothetical protein B0H63DRAFT_468092 [Podospora didyma]
MSFILFSVSFSLCLPLSFLSFFFFLLSFSLCLFLSLSFRPFFPPRSNSSGHGRTNEWEMIVYLYDLSPSENCTDK